MGTGNPQPVGGPRGEVQGWSAAAVRRHKRWLYSVECSRLSGRGSAVTLTLRDIPPDHEAWRHVLARLFDRLRFSGMTRWHWVVEWQRRGAPHVHLAVYHDDLEPDEIGAVVIGHWRALTAKPYGAAARGQTATEITGPAGWLKYLSKHASRGVAHYQRQGMPPGWSKTGRLWGYGGDWPTEEPVAGVLDQRQFWAVRRMVRRYAVAQARAAALKYAAADHPDSARKAAAAWDSVAWTRRMLSCNDRALSTVRGVSDWVPGPVFVDLALCAGWSGEVSEPASSVAAR